MLNEVRAPSVSNHLIFEIITHLFQEQCVTRHAFARIAAASVVQDIEKPFHRNLFLCLHR